MDKETGGRDPLFLVYVQRGWHLQMTWRLMGSWRVSLDSLKEGGVLPSPRASHIFPFMSEDFKAKEAGSASCGVGQKAKDAATSPLGGGKEPTGCVLFSHSGYKHGSSEMEGSAFHCLAASHTAKVNPSACPKGLLQSWPATTRAWSHQAEAHRPRMALTHHSLPSWAGICVTSSCRLWHCLWAACLQPTPISGAKWVEPGDGMPKAPKDSSRGDRAVTLPGRMHPCAASVALTHFPYNTVFHPSCNSMYRTLLLKCEAVYHPSL